MKQMIEKVKSSQSALQNDVDMLIVMIEEEIRRKGLKYSGSLWITGNLRRPKNGRPANGYMRDTVYPPLHEWTCPDLERPFRAG